jgi:hypothetical protein
MGAPGAAGWGRRGALAAAPPSIVAPAIVATRVSAVSGSITFSPRA